MMTKTELIEQVAERSGVGKNQVHEIVNNVLDTIVEATANGEKVQLMGFGTFEAVERGPRSARNPQTGESMEVEAHIVPRFKPGRAFKNAVNS